MKTNLTLIIAALLCFTVNAQETDKYLEKVGTVDQTIESLYAVISGEKGVERDWDLFRYLFYSDAKLIPSGKNRDGVIGARYLTPEDYVERSGPWLKENGFFEKEIHRVTQEFGYVVHVFSTYEAFRSEADEEPFMRGINSIQLMNDGTRWWILNIYWTQESPENPIPEEYLPD